MVTQLKSIHVAGDAENASFAEAVEQLTCLVEAGEHERAVALIDEIPEYADKLRRILPAIEALASLDDPITSLPATGEGLREGASSGPGLLGDFRIQREIGRGGMGVVYEATQISLNRRVALKVLPLAAMLDARRLERFRHEAQAAAMLRHPNIVSVFSVGCERGVHYYAMDYIEGPSLAQLAEQLRARSKEQRSTSGKGCSPPLHGEGLGDGSQSGATAGLSSSAIWRGAPDPARDTVAAAHLLTLPTPSSTLPAFASRDYFRAIARLGIQAAEALDYAHQMGIVHRDVKPSNLLIDAQGHLWITDFGLAMTQSDAGLTMTGDLLGTLRYMSPEQAAGKRLPLDHRTDVYSLGITLYELLAGRPAFDTIERGELLHAIAEAEPTPLRKLAPTIPVDLETIVHKAIEKDAADRYSTAEELADDLRRFSENRAIRARRPTSIQHLRKFARRHRAATAIVAGAAFLFLILSVAFAADRRRANLEARRVLEASVQTGLAGYWPFDGDGSDASHLGRDLTLKGRVGFAPGMFGQALDLHKNQNTYAERRANGAEYKFGVNDFTIQNWVNFYSTSTEQVLIEKLVGGSGAGWSLTKPGSNVFQFFARGQYNSPPQSIATNVWSHIVVRRKEQQIQIWRDGEIILVSYFHGVSETEAPLCVGRRHPADARDFSLNGRLDEVAIWNRALTNEEIAHLYNSGMGNPVSRTHVTE